MCRFRMISVSDSLTVEYSTTAEVRLLATREQTIETARALEAAGAVLLTVHGRTREENKERVGAARWAEIAEVKRAVSIPVFANGGIERPEDVDACLAETGCDGVMSSEGALGDPTIFALSAARCYAAETAAFAEAANAEAEVSAAVASAVAEVASPADASMTAALPRVPPPPPPPPRSAIKPAASSRPKPPPPPRMPLEMPTKLALVRKYLEIERTLRAPHVRFVRGHIFKLIHEAGRAALRSCHVRPF
jgi:tRNA-dihydrouridine synthase